MVIVGMYLLPACNEECTKVFMHEQIWRCYVLQHNSKTSPFEYVWKSQACCIRTASFELMSSVRADDIPSLLLGYGQKRSIELRFEISRVFAHAQPGGAGDGSVLTKNNIQILHLFYCEI